MVEQNSIQNLGGGANPTSPLQFDKKEYRILPILIEETYPWLLKKHYAHRIPAIQEQFGLYKNNILVGVCCFGSPCRMLNNAYGLFKGKLSIPTWELVRLVINENLGKNVLSFFVSMVIKNIKPDRILISYADGNVGHHGYIYQSTNWFYTGITQQETTYKDKRTRKQLHPRTVVSMFGSREKSKLPDYIEIDEEGCGKFRYLYFITNKENKIKWLKELTYPILPYPKGDNKRYDASFQPETQGILF